jgi:hypothetical protein
VRRAAVLLLAVFAAACSLDRPGATSGPPSGAEETVEATVGVAAGDERRGGSAGVPFVANPEASGGSSHEADTILAVRYGVHEGYERVVLDLGTGDEPAEVVPEWTLMSPKGDGLLRVTLPSVSATGVSDGRFGDDLLKSFYVVRAPEGGMFVDVLARKAFTYRVLGLSDPARLVIDFKPSGRSLGVPLPRAGGNTVLVEPRAGTRIGDHLTVSGYSRNFEASNTVVLVDSKGEVVVQQTVESNDWSESWGHFEATLDLPSFGRRGTLQVGTQSARDGSFKGVEVPIHR